VSALDLAMEFPQARRSVVSTNVIVIYVRTGGRADGQTDKIQAVR
jgi:hypothetical protein